MDDIRESVRRFLAEFTLPGEEDIQDFVSDIASENPSLDAEGFKKNLHEIIRQRDRLRAYKKEASSLGKESPVFNELESVLKEAEQGHESLEDISEELKTARKLLSQLKGDGAETAGDAGERPEPKGEASGAAAGTAAGPAGQEATVDKAPEQKEGTNAGKTEGQRELKETAAEAPAGATAAAEAKGAEAPKQAEVAAAAEAKGAEVPKQAEVAAAGKVERTEENAPGKAEAAAAEQQEKIQAGTEKKSSEQVKETPAENIDEVTEGKASEPSGEVQRTEKAQGQMEKAQAEGIAEAPAEGAVQAGPEEEVPEQLIEDELEEEEELPVQEEAAGEQQTEGTASREGEWTPPEGTKDMMARIDKSDSRDLLKDQFTPEKQAVFELLEEKLLSDVETRIKKLKEIQTKAPEAPPQTFLGKIKTFLTSESESVETYDVALHGPLVTFDGLEGFNEIERYWVNEPYAFVVILFDPENNSHLYYVAEPVLTEFEDVFLKEIKDRLKDVLLVEDVKNEEDKDKILTGKVRQLVKDYTIDITPITLEKVLYYTRRDFIYFGKIDPLMHDNRIEDISANGHDIPIYLYHKKYTNIPTNIYYNETELNSYVIRLAQRCGKHISIAEPMIDATMPDGSRIQMTLGTEVTSRGATFTIRKFSEIPITPIDLINWNTFSAEELAYLWLCIENNKSLIYAGGTASGKTSSLNAVSLFIPHQAKIVTLEDTRELKLPHPNWIPGVTRDSFTADGRGGIDMYELLRAALRQRPEFLLVGEVRGKEALTLFQAMSTGHTTFSTMHADSVASAIHRLENPPISVPRTMIQALNIISIQSQTYVKGKRARRNMKLVEITDIDPTTRNIRTNDIFVWDPLTDKFIRTGESKALNEIMIRRGWSPTDLRNELTNRQKILEFMVNNKITDFNAISTIIHDYQATPEKVLTKLNITG